MGVPPVVDPLVVGPVVVGHPTPIPAPVVVVVVIVMVLCREKKQITPYTMSGPNCEWEVANFFPKKL